jgi:hypothetical protein
MAIINTYPVVYPEGTVTDDGLWIVANLNGLNGEYLRWVKNGGEDGGGGSAGAVSGINTATGTPLAAIGGVVTLPPIPAVLNSFTSTSTADAASANTVRVLEQALMKAGAVDAAGILTLTDRSSAALSPPIDLSSLKATIIDGLTSISATSVLSANQGSILNAADLASVAIVGSNLNFTLKGGAVMPVNIAALQLDVKLTAAAYNPATKAIDFTLSNGSIISMPAAALLPVVVDGITVKGDGNTTALSVGVSSRVGNALTVTPQGLDVVLPAAPVTTVSNAVSGIGLTRQLTTTVNGVTGSPVFIPDQNNRDIVFSGTAAAPTISNDNFTFVPLPPVPPSSNTFAITKAAGAVSTVQGVSGTQLIPNGTIVETLGYNAAGVPVYQVLPSVTLDGNDKHILRTNAIANIAPTALEVATPIAGDTAKVSLADKSIEYWTYGTAWTKDFTYSITPDDIVDVAGATLPITFPVATIPGTPVFVPATPTSTTAIYAITNGTAITYAKWSGTQYISAPAPAAAPGHFRSGTGATGPDGVNDPIENIARIGKTGLGIADPSAVLFTLENGGTTGVRADVLANATAVCTIPAVATNLKSSIVVTQTVSDAVLLFAAPNVAAMAGQQFTVTNSDLSTHKISYLGYDIHPNQTLNFVHTGRMWQIEEVGINSDVQLETAVTVLPTSTTALNSFTVVPGGIQSSTTAWVEVPGTSFVATVGGEYLVKYVAYASCTGTAPNLPAVGNGFRIAVGSNVVTGTVQTVNLVTGRVIETSQSLITNLVANQIDSYTKTVIVKAKAGDTIQLQMNSVVGQQIVYQSATQNSRLEWARIVNTVGASLATGLLDTSIVASATPYTVLPTDSTIAFSGAFSGVGQVNMPPAAANLGRIVTLRMPPTNTFSLNVLSGGGNIELPNYTLTGSARLSSAALGSISWQSDGTSWRLFNYDERKFYATAGYNAPSSFSTFLGSGGVNPAPGLAFQIPAGTTAWVSLDSNISQFVALPASNNATGRFSLYASNSAGFPTTISFANTDLPRDFIVNSGLGLSMHFEWSDGLWRWVPSPEPSSAAIKYPRRGTFAAPLTGAVTMLPNDDLLVVGNGAVVTMASPAAANIDVRRTIKKPLGAIATLIGNIDGVNYVAAPGTPVYTMSVANESLTFQPDGATWMRI